MGRAGKALKKILEAYDISQYQLAAKMEIDRSNVSRIYEVHPPIVSFPVGTRHCRVPTLHKPGIRCMLSAIC
ncbi:helix-turn-helix transcriptional regulator [Microcoleus sp. N3A4]|uniref:helix-turn-helix transcriptional regulator n=1 Tax=Microcoleus sp. N3A4 TaxID=3055379 RepID=UPI002FD5FA15